MKKLILICLFIFCSVQLYAKDRSVIFFVDSIDDMSQKVVDKIISSKNFRFVAKINAENSLSENIEKLISAGKLEPTLEINCEPYLPLISDEIIVDSSVDLDRTKDLTNLLENYKLKYSHLFNNTAYGLFLSGGVLNNKTLQVLYDNDFVWTTAKAENKNLSGAFYNNGMIVFALAKNFPKNQKLISNWLSKNKNKVMTVFLTKAHLQDEKLMLYIINLFENSKYTDVVLPTEIIEQTTKLDEVVLLKNNKLPKDILLKLVAASNEIDDQKGSKLYESIFSEFSNMYSYNLISRILKGDETAKQLFDISYKNIFKLSNKEAPSINVSLTSSYDIDNDERNISHFVKSKNGFILESSGNIKSFEIQKSSEYIDFVIDSNYTLTSFDIYIDMNGIIDTGNHSMLKPLEGFLAPENSWEYAIRFENNTISIYKFFIDTCELVKTLKTTNNRIRIPTSVLRGNPYNWAYQVVIFKDNKVIDFLANKQERELFLSITPLQLKLFKCNE